MKLLLLSLSLLFTTSPLALGEVKDELRGELIFPDGDSLPGLPGGISPENFLLWDSPLFLKSQSPFRSKAIDSIHFSTTAPQNNGSTIASITFQSRVDKLFDVIEGELLSFDDHEVKLRTWYAGDLSLKRKMLRSIKVATEAPAIVKSPRKIEDWQRIGDRGAEAWQVDGKNLVSLDRGSIAKELPELPNQIKLEFELEYNFSPSLRIYFFADSGEDWMPQTGYSISIQRGPVQFLKKVNNLSTPLQMKAIGRRPSFREEKPTKIDIYIDRAKGQFTLYLDGEPITSATDPDPLLDTNWWHLSSIQNRNHIISEFAIRSWNGKLPQPKGYLDFRQDLPILGEQIELHNGDTIIGKATDIKKGKLHIETEFVPISVPISRLRSFQITSQEEREEPKAYPRDIRAHFHHGGHVTLRLSDISNTNITGYSQVFGMATFDLRAFTHIDFNVYDTEFRIRRGHPF